MRLGGIDQDMIKPIEQAEQLIQEGKLDEARDVLMQALRTHPRKKGLYQEAVNLLLYEEMFEEAKQVFQLYQSQTGNDLGGDFSLDEIEHRAEQGVGKELAVCSFRCESFQKNVISRIFGSTRTLNQLVFIAIDKSNTNLSRSNYLAQVGKRLYVSMV